MSAFNNTDINTNPTNMGFNRRWNRSNKDESVSFDFEPLLNHYEDFLTNEDIKESQLTKPLEDFKKTLVDIQGVAYKAYLQYATDTKILQGNRQLYSHFVMVFNYFVENNLVHIDKKDQYLKSLNQIFYSSDDKINVGKSKEKFEKVDYSKYDNTCDFRNVTNDQLLNQIFEKGGEIYSNSKNKIHMKIHKDDTLLPYSIREAESILSRIMRFKVKITDESLKYDDIDMEAYVFESTSYEVHDVKKIGEKHV